MLTAILVAVGILSSLIFHLGTKEPSSSPPMPLRKLSTLAATNLAVSLTPLEYPSSRIFSLIYRILICSSIMLVIFKWSLTNQLQQLLMYVDDFNTWNLATNIIARFKLAYSWESKVFFGLKRMLGKHLWTFFRATYFSWVRIAFHFLSIIFYISGWRISFRMVVLENQWQVMQKVWVHFNVVTCFLFVCLFAYLFLCLSSFGFQD